MFLNHLYLYYQNLIIKFLILHCLISQTQELYNFYCFVCSYEKLTGFNNFNLSQTYFCICSLQCHLAFLLRDNLRILHLKFIFTHYSNNFYYKFTKFFLEVILVLLIFFYVYWTMRSHYFQNYNLNLFHLVLILHFTYPFYLL